MGNGKWKIEDGKTESISPFIRMLPIRSHPGRQTKAKQRPISSLSDGRDSGNQTYRGPVLRPGRFFDIYIQ
jgi:hypothetical protein